KILFLDEPTIGLDVVSQKKIRDFLRDYNERKKATIILTSHYMEDIRRLCNRVMIIDHGTLIYDGEYRKLQAQHGGQKTVEMTFLEQVARQDLEIFGDIIQYQGSGATITIPREKTAEITAQLLKKLPIDDISIHEKDMEEIIREIFGRR
ncbi:MAG: ABC transporter, partial [Patescibacteria group bacterium]